MKENLSTQQTQEIRVRPIPVPAASSSLWSYGRDFAVLSFAVLILFWLVLFQNQGLPHPLALFRLSLGIFVVLFAPGYTLQAILFPRNTDCDAPERLTLSFVLSLVLISVFALILDRLPWRLHLWPMFFSLGSFILAGSLVAILRRLSIPLTECHMPSLQLNLGERFTGLDLNHRIIYALLAIALAAGLFSAASILMIPEPASRFTEFYALGPEGLAEKYPRESKVGETLKVTLGIKNNEGSRTTFHIEVWIVDKSISGHKSIVAQSGPITLEKGQDLAIAQSWQMPWSGQDQIVEFLLFVDGNPEPYRRLRLFVDVK